jgi:heme exporter protein C
MKIKRFFHQFASPRFIYNLGEKVSIYFCVLAFIFIGLGTYQGLFIAPPDYLQGDAFRIIYIHVPTAYISLLCYVIIAVASFIAYVWHIKLGYYASQALAPIGAVFTVLALLTGAIWGKPMWGSYWQWTDPRMMSELLLLFLYLGFIILSKSFNEQEKGDRVSSILAIVGIINIPIIHYSVEWWSSIHQGATLMKKGGPSIDPSMLTPLLFMLAGITCYFIYISCLRLNTIILIREQGARWQNGVNNNE